VGEDKNRNVMVVTTDIYRISVFSEDFSEPGREDAERSEDD